MPRARACPACEPARSRIRPARELSSVIRRGGSRSSGPFRGSPRNITSCCLA
ncbi:hypothetical protein ACFPRL_31205 [Pseudoclavibacter helvolus]